MTAPTPGVILALAPNPWEGPWMNRQQLLSRLGVGRTILYSTGVPQRGRRKGPAGGVGGRVVRADHVYLDAPPSWLLRPNRPAVAGELVDAIAARRLRRLARELGTGPVLTYVFHPKFWPLARRIGGDRLVFHAYDLYHLQGKQTHTYDREEQALARAADLVIGSSTPIAEYLRTISGRHVETLDNAADYAAFSAPPLSWAEGPPDVAALPRPRVGYTGALNRKVDFELLADLSARRPDVQFVLIGQMGRLDAVGESAAASLRQRTNVHWLGFKSPAALPGYMGAMDANLMCYRASGEAWTAGIYPLKLHEYLAVGRPVISTDLPTVRPFADVIRIATSPDDWASALNEALRDGGTGTPEARRARARDNSWDARAAQLGAWIDDVMGRRTETSSSAR
ncbi:hypothetical protein TBR22_A24190 [Luteitalea sp. TBR-22]|uniref:glycosyltransferase n=1 Tax=Luteitalea sp. TBR-22 TaxID=2802971 RepID=UPI001AF13D74|nr:glycosyltransferase [Luteitalea sp. TBR-22]BCS33192.1 hypothetical protein TBR22_A24190 [Luteitalea sp. TBR-22]